MTSHQKLHIYRPLRWASAVTVAPAQEPVLLEEMKSHARIEAPEETALMAGNIVAARRWVEGFTYRALISQTWTLKLDTVPSRDDALIELPGGRVQSVSSITYTDSDGATQTWDAADYEVDTDSEPGRVGLAYDKSWPTIREWGLPITITYDVGYGDDPSDVPEELRTAIRMLALELFENRQESDDVSLNAVPWGAKTLASRYRIIRLA